MVSNSFEKRRAQWKPSKPQSIIWFERLALIATLWVPTCLIGYLYSVEVHSYYGLAHPHHSLFYYMSWSLVGFSIPFALSSPIWGAPYWLALITARTRFGGARWFILAFALLMLNTAIWTFARGGTKIMPFFFLIWALLLGVTWLLTVSEESKSWLKSYDYR